MSRHAYTARSACLGIALTVFTGLAISTPGIAQEEKRYDTGASDAAIKIGNTAPYSGPLSSNGIIARAEGAYFKMINDQGGMNGRKIEFISYDDAYSPWNRPARSSKCNCRSSMDRAGCALAPP